MGHAHPRRPTPRGETHTLREGHHLQSAAALSGRTVGVARAGIDHAGAQTPSRAPRPRVRTVAQHPAVLRFEVRVEATTARTVFIPRARTTFDHGHVQRRGPGYDQRIRRERRAPAARRQSDVRTLGMEHALLTSQLDSRESYCAKNRSDWRLHEGAGMIAQRETAARALIPGAIGSGRGARGGRRAG